MREISDNWGEEGEYIRRRIQRNVLVSPKAWKTMDKGQQTEMWGFQGRASRGMHPPGSRRSRASPGRALGPRRMQVVSCTAKIKATGVVRRCVTCQRLVLTRAGGAMWLYKEAADIRGVVVQLRITARVLLGPARDARRDPTCARCRGEGRAYTPALCLLDGPLPLSS